MWWINLTSRISRQLASSFGYKIDCLLIPKLSRTTSNRTTKYIIFFTIFPIIVTSGPVQINHTNRLVFMCGKCISFHLVRFGLVCLINPVEMRIYRMCNCECSSNLYVVKLVFMVVFVFRCACVCVNCKYISKFLKCSCICVNVCIPRMEARLLLLLLFS